MYVCACLLVCGLGVCVCACSCMNGSCCSDVCRVNSTAVCQCVSVPLLVLVWLSISVSAGSMASYRHCTPLLDVSACSSLSLSLCICICCSALLFLLARPLAITSSSPPHCPPLQHRTTHKSLFRSVNELSVYACVCVYVCVCVCVCVF